MSAERQRAFGCMDGLISCQQGCWDAARQPSCMITEVHSWLPNTFCATHPLHCTNLHRLGAGFERIIPKLIQNKRVISRHVTPCCTETTLGVSKSNSLLGLKLKAACRDVKPEPPKSSFQSQYLCNLRYSYKYCCKICISAIFFVPDTTKKFSHWCLKHDVGWMIN